MTTYETIASLLEASDDEDPLLTHNSQPSKFGSHKLTKMQDEIMYAIETVNANYFVDIGGLSCVDLNFEVGIDNNFPLFIASVKGSPYFIKLMLQNQFIDINKTDKNGVNSFWIACFCGNGNVMKVLAEHGIDIFNADEKGDNVLHLAAKKNYHNIVKMLIKSQFPLDLVNLKGKSALAIAAQKGNLKIVKALEKAGADVNKTDFQGIGPLYLAILNDQVETAQYLIEQGASYYYEQLQERELSPIFLSIRKENPYLLEVMCDHGAKLTVKDSEGRTPLMYASAKGYNEIVNYLTLRTKDLNEEDANSLTILMHYLFKNDFKMAAKLIVRGANIDYVNRNGNTALHLCIENNYFAEDQTASMAEAVAFLLKKGANPHIMDLNDEDACDKAKKNGLAILIPQFNNCNPRLKKKCKLPEHQEYEVTPNKEKEKITNFEIRQSQIRESLRSSTSSNLKVIRVKSRGKAQVQQSLDIEGTQTIREDQQQENEASFTQKTDNKATRTQEILPELLTSHKETQKLLLQQEKQNQELKKQIENFTTIQQNELKKLSEQIKQDFHKTLEMERQQRQEEIEKFKQEKDDYLRTLIEEQKREKQKYQEMLEWEKQQFTQHRKQLYQMIKDEESTIISTLTINSEKIVKRVIDQSLVAIGSADKQRQELSSGYNKQRKVESQLKTDDSKNELRQQKEELKSRVQKRQSQKKVEDIKEQVLQEPVQESQKKPKRQQKKEEEIKEQAKAQVQVQVEEKPKQKGKKQIVEEKPKREIGDIGGLNQSSQRSNLLSMDSSFATNVIKIESSIPNEGPNVRMSINEDEELCEIRNKSNLVGSTGSELIKKKNPKKK